MPYIITVRDPIAADQSKHVGEDNRLRYNADGSEVFPGATGVRPSKGSVRAVATLEDAIQWVCEYADEYDAPTPGFDALASAIAPHGGTVGPLPDGMVIEVQPITWADLASKAGFYAPPQYPNEREELLDAFNGCDCSTFVPGALWPMASDGDDSLPYVERCDDCEVFDTDDAAAEAIAAKIGGRVMWAHLLGHEEHHAGGGLHPFVLPTDFPLPAGHPLAKGTP